MKSSTKEISDDLCTVVFRLKNGRADANRFVYALACRVEQWKDVEVVSLDVGEWHYETQANQGSEQGEAK
jgi:hypothetical protein